ncbi:conserved hypothetical protein [Ricinus communis]|uniref:Uncharacterized protein n=1 Tax=Ricinus communis TaxID=3988 RepID=B9SEX7_RICCO|nr:conserved hypothetical protein [Ricinus communis]
MSEVVKGITRGGRVYNDMGKQAIVEQNKREAEKEKEKRGKEEGILRAQEDTDQGFGSDSGVDRGNPIIEGLGSTG